MEKRVRIHNDLVVRWSIEAEHGPYALVGKDLRLCLHGPDGIRVIDNYQVENNAIRWVFHGKDQKYTGRYSLSLVENPDKVGMHTVDICNAFILVARSCETGGADSGSLQVEYLELSSKVDFGDSPDQELSDQSTNAISNRAVTIALRGKVDEVEGKGLSSNDYTDDEREKLSSLQNYDDSGIKDELKNKQDAIKDLDAIRQGASKGATALQEVPQEYAKKTDVANGLSGKVDKVAGKGLSTYDFNDSRVEEIARAGNEPIRIRWEDLKDLRDNNELIEGRLYRITDFVTTTTQENTQTAGHRFDIIVLALNNHTLAEEAWAIYSEEDSYFADHGANLSAWKIWYCLDNNRERFAWADENNGKGVIYRMIDEWNNDLPYDFKNIQFKRYILEADDAFETDVAKGGELEIVREKLRKMSHKIHTCIWYYGEYITDVFPNADEQARYVPFGDTQYIVDGPQVLCPIDENNFGWFYTFHNEDEDASLLMPNVDDNIGVQDNTIKDNNYVFFVEDGTGSYYPTKTNAQNLNDIVFVGDFCSSNSFGNQCYYNSFGNDCNYNSFGNGCNFNSFGNGCIENSFGNGCHENSFGNDCNFNSFGNQCYCNSFGNEYISNSFGNGCHENSFGNTCFYNSFGNECYRNSFGNACSYNSFGNACFSNSFGNGCYSNSFRNNCYYNSFGNNCYSNSFGNECMDNTFIDQEGAAHGLSYNRFDNGVREVQVYVDQMPDKYESVQYNHVCSGVSGNFEFYADEPFGYTYTINSDGEVMELVLGDLPNQLKNLIISTLNTPV